MGGGSVRRAVMAGGGSVVVAAAVALALGGPAEGRGGPPCPKQALCVWQHEDFQGKRVVITGTGISNEIAEKLDDEATALFNRRGKVSRLYARKNANGNVFCAGPQDQIPNFGDFNDMASSSKLTSKPGCPF
jgi:Peptidase inhibitor family I36